MADIPDDAAPVQETPQATPEPDSRPIGQIIGDDLRQAFAEAEAAGDEDAPTSSESSAPKATADSAEAGEALSPSSSATSPETGGAQPLAEHHGASQDQGDPPGSGSAALEQFSPEQRAVLEALPDDDRQVVLDWASELRRGADTKFREAATARQAIETALQPIAQQIRTAGLAPTDAIAPLVALYQGMAENPLDTMQRLLGAESVSGTLKGGEQARTFVAQAARALGVDIGTGNGEADPWQADDDQSKRLGALELKYQDLLRDREVQQAADQERTVATAAQTVEQFQTAKDASGQVAHPHFATVSGLMTSLIRGAVATSLEDAYEKAVRMEGLASPAPKASGNGQDLERAKRASSRRPSGGRQVGREPDPIEAIKDPDPKRQMQKRFEADLRRQMEAATQ